MFKSRRPDHEKFTVRSSLFTVGLQTHRPMFCWRHSFLLERGCKAPVVLFRKNSPTASNESHR